MHKFMPKPIPYGMTILNKLQDSSLRCMDTLKSKVRASSTALHHKLREDLSVVERLCMRGKESTMVF